MRRNPFLHHPRTRLFHALAFAAAFWALVPSAARSWEGHDWNHWREATKAQKPQIASPQAGLSEILPLLRSAGPDSPLIDSIHNWEAKRDRILRVLHALIGEPSNLTPPRPEAQLLGEEDLGTYTRRHLKIRSEPDDWIPAYLLLPKNLTPPSPAMIVLHQTVAQGKEEPCGIKGDPQLAIAIELVGRGFICLVPDAVGFGERIPAGSQPYATTQQFYQRHPGWSFFGKMAWDGSRIVDYLETLPEVNSRHIGLIGHSHGGYGTIIGAVLEPRISAAVASCAYTTLRADDHPNRWSHITPLLPRLGFYMEDVAQTPIDWHEIIACIAPRPFFDWMPTEDANFPNTENFVATFDDLRKIYGLYGAADNLALRRVPGPHSFPSAARNEGYAWLENALPASIEKRELISRDIGPLSPPKLETRFTVIEEHARGGYTETKIEYLAAENEPIKAYVLTPDGPPTGEKGSSAILVFHQTVPEGKEEPAGHMGRADLHFGPVLARRGYVVLIPDSICAGERITASGAFDTRDFYAAHPNLSAMGKMIQDGRRAIDIVVTVQGVDPKRIGVIGHSLGAEEALFVAAFDDRVKAAAASCGFAPFSAEKNPERWARDRWFSYMPRLRVDLRAGRLPAWDFGDVIGLVAPRGYFNYQTTEDEIFPEGPAIGPIIESLRPLWKRHSAEDRLRSIIEPGPHGISPSATEEVFQWFDKTLNPARPQP